MGNLIPNTFTSYELTEKEQLEGMILSSLQKQVLQNERAQIAEEKLNLDFNPAEPDSFIQADAFKKGQLAVIAWQLASSEAAELALVRGTKFESTESLED